MKFCFLLVVAIIYVGSCFGISSDSNKTEYLILKNIYLYKLLESKSDIKTRLLDSSGFICGSQILEGIYSLYNPGMKVVLRPILRPFIDTSYKLYDVTSTFTADDHQAYIIDFETEKYEESPRFLVAMDHKHDILYLSGHFYQSDYYSKYYKAVFGNAGKCDFFKSYISYKLYYKFSRLKFVSCNFQDHRYHYLVQTEVGKFNVVLLENGDIDLLAIK